MCVQVPRSKTHRGTASRRLPPSSGTEVAVGWKWPPGSPPRPLRAPRAETRRPRAGLTFAVPALQHRGVFPDQGGQSPHVPVRRCLGNQVQADLFR